MSSVMNPAAPHHLPVFITAPGESDAFLIGVAIFLVFVILALGSIYFRLHALPEHMAHKNASKLQFEVVAVLALLALFTHNNIFWVAALILALVPIPDFHGPLSTMADSLARIAGLRRPAPAAEATPVAVAHDATSVAPDTAPPSPEPAAPEPADEVHARPA